MPSINETTARLATYAAEYSAKVWPESEYVPPTNDDLAFMEVRADGYSNQHNTQDSDYHDCGYTTSTKYGERAAAAEYVETH